MAKSENFCGVEHFGVMIPYRDLEKLLQIANNFERFEKRLSQVDEQLLALRMIQSETMDKIGEIQRMI